MTHEYSPYLGTEQTLDHQAPFGERTKVFTHPNLHKRKLNVDPGMLDVWELLNEHGINYTMLGLLCGVSGITISGRMINGCPADTKAEMKARIKSLDSLRVMEQSPPPKESEPIGGKEELSRKREEEDARRWRIFTKWAGNVSTNGITVEVLQMILQLQAEKFSFDGCAENDDGCSCDTREDAGYYEDEVKE